MRETFWNGHLRAAQKNHMYWDIHPQTPQSFHILRCTLTDQTPPKPAHLTWKRISPHIQGNTLRSEGLCPGMYTDKKIRGFAAWTQVRDLHLANSSEISHPEACKPNKQIRDFKSCNIHPQSSQILHVLKNTTRKYTRWQNDICGTAHKEIRRFSILTSNISLISAPTITSPFVTLRPSSHGPPCLDIHSHLVFSDP